MTHSDDMKDVWRKHTEVQIAKVSFGKSVQFAKQSFKLKYKKWIRLLDIGLALVILFNISAIFLTNAMVVRVHPNVTMVEANPAMAEAGNFETTPEAQSQFNVFKLLVFFWGAVVSVFIYNRAMLYRKWQLYLLTLLIVLLLFMTGLDLVGNLGYWFGINVFS